MSNTWVTYPTGAGQQLERAANTAFAGDGYGCYQERMASSMLSPEDGLASHQLVGEVMAHQGLDG